MPFNLQVAELLQLVGLNDQYDDERVIATSSGNSNNNISGAECDEQRRGIRSYSSSSERLEGLRTFRDPADGLGWEEKPPSCTLLNFGFGLAVSTPLTPLILCTTVNNLSTVVEKTQILDEKKREGSFFLLPNFLL